MTRRTSHRNPATIRLRGRGPSPAVERLLRDFAEASFPNPLGSAERNERVLKGIDALVRLEPDGRKVFVAEVRALRPRQGIGTRAMQFLTDLADKHGVQLALFPHPFGTSQMEVGALVNFYRRFGFQYADEDGEAGDEMVRFPRESNPRRRVRRNPHPQTETPEFERWFGNSKMIDAEGKPQRLYHMTAAEFTEFKPGGHDPSLSGRVIYLTPYPHAIPAGHNTGGTVRGERYRPGTSVMPVYASIQRPLYIFDADDAQYAERFKLDSFAFPRTVSDKSLAALKAAGYDGIVYGGYRDAEGFDIYTGRNVEIIAFEPTQIKSAIGNAGTFDPEDPNILRNPRRRVRHNPQPQTETPAFKRWFKKSKVVDAEGNPLVVYHGTSAVFDTFDVKESFDGGFHFGTAEAATNRIADGAGLDPSGWRHELSVYPNIMPVYLSIQRPLRLSFDPYDEETWAEGIERAKDKGYDGIVYPNAVEGGESWVAFSPTQIKSATGNRGTFDPEDPNIMHNPRHRAAPRRALRLVRPPRRALRRNGISNRWSVTLSPAVAAFAEEWRTRGMDKVFEDMGVRVDVLLEGGDYIELELIEALTPGRGDGSRALRALLDLVDKHNLGVTLNAMPFRRYDATASTTLPGLDDLVRIYQRFGFRLEEGVEDWDEDEDEGEEPESYYMARPPRR